MPRATGLQYGSDDPWTSLNESFNPVLGGINGVSNLGKHLGNGCDIGVIAGDYLDIQFAQIGLALTVIPGAGLLSAGVKALLKDGIKAALKTALRGLLGGGERVAANTGEDLTTIGRWMGDEELAQMQSTGRVVEAASDGRTFVVNPANPAAFPAGTGNFVEFRVPTSSWRPAGKPEWSVIPGPNVTTTRWGPPPAEMPPATCITVVCVR